MIEVALAAAAEVGEGPMWDTRRNALIWVDIYRGEVHLFDPASVKTWYSRRAARRRGGHDHGRRPGSGTA